MKIPIAVSSSICDYTNQLSSLYKRRHWQLIAEVLIVQILKSLVQTHKRNIITRENPMGFLVVSGQSKFQKEIIIRPDL